MDLERAAPVILHLRVTPNASKSEICGQNENEEIRVRLQAPPVDGKANKALIAFLSKVTDLKKNQITITKGETSRQKWVAFESIDRTDLLTILSLSD